jgi:hypothetical protein
LLLNAQAQDFITGEKIDHVNFFDKIIDIHHVFPRYYCKKTQIPSEKHDSIINKTPLSLRTNRVIGANAPSAYLKKIEKTQNVSPETLNGWIDSHLIDSAALRADNFDDFFLKRRKALLGLIGEAMGKPVTGLDEEEAVNEHGASLS